MAEKLTIDQQHADMGKSVPLIETRLFDLVRYARNYLFDEQLITLGEWTWLLTAPEGPHSPSARRLESYDELRATIAEQAATIARLEGERDEAVTDYVMRHYIHPTYALCMLCGNSGKVDTRRRAVSGAGFDAGSLVYCLCPNGQALRSRGAAIKEKP